MPEFTYVFKQPATHVVTVEAESREAGENAARDRLPASLCYQCAREFDLAGDWELDEEATEECTHEIVHMGNCAGCGDFINYTWDGHEPLPDEARADRVELETDRRPTKLVMPAMPEYFAPSVDTVHTAAVQLIAQGQAARAAGGSAWQLWMSAHASALFDQLEAELEQQVVQPLATGQRYRNGSGFEIVIVEQRRSYFDSVLPVIGDIWLAEYEGPVFRRHTLVTADGLVVFGYKLLEEKAGNA
ncbi:hypothetical protein ACFXG4_08510 [Nocardia sp. NPDC059246]|uniref:hypothetical protein n=1 Tax=unclassified Nocardia TaxID=2637762 RepID=UPI00367D9F2B